MIPLFAVHSPVVDLMPALHETLKSGQLTEGPKVKEFEKALEGMLGHDQQRVLATNSCTSALHLAYKLAGIGPGTTVLASPMSCFASYAAVLELGGNIEWCDVTDQGLLDVRWIRERLFHRQDIRAVLVVYWGGTPLANAHRSMLQEDCRRAGVKIIVDAAHAAGIDAGHLAGAYATLSFQAIKLINTLGDGGALVVPKEDYLRARRLRWFGLDREMIVDPLREDGRVDADIPEHGLKWHMNDVAATAGLVQLPHVHKLLAKHCENSEYYTRRFAEKLLDGGWRLPPYASRRDGTAWLYTLQAPSRLLRDQLRVYLHTRGIQASQVHRRCDTHSCMKHFRRPQLPGVDRFDSTALCIPVHWALTEKEREYIAGTVLAFYKANS